MYVQYLYNTYGYCNTQFSENDKGRHQAMNGLCGGEKAMTTKNKKNNNNNNNNKEQARSGKVRVRQGQNIAGELYCTIHTEYRVTEL